MNLGVSFSPTNQSAQGTGTPNTANPVQDAIRILSFRLPTVLGASAATPMQNLGAPSIFGSQLGSSVIQNFLKSLMMPSATGQASSPYGSLFGGTSAPSAASAPPVSISLGGSSPIVTNPTGPSPSAAPSQSASAPSMGSGMPNLPQMPNIFGGGPKQA